MGNGVMKSTIAIAGEKEYKQALREIKLAQEEVKSELEYLSAAFAKNTTSMEAYRAKAEALQRLQITYKDQLVTQANAIGTLANKIIKHKEALESLSKQIADNKEKIAENTKVYGENSEEVKKVVQETEKLKKTYADHQKGLQTAQNEQSRLRTEYNKTLTEIEKLNGEIEANSKAMADAEKSADGYADDLKDIGDAADKSADGLDLAGLATDKLQKLLTVGGILSALKMLKDAFDAVIDSSRAFESAFAGVIKTVNASPEELKVLRDEIVDLSNQIPMTITEISGIAEAAGQLGIETDSIIEFSEVMAKLGVATDVTAEAAATMLAQFAKVTGMDSSDYDRLGSTIVELGNNFATTESKIIETAQRLSGAGTVVGLSESDILAVAAALSSIGIEAEAGGSAISKLLKKIETATKTYDDAREAIDQTGMSLRDLEMLQSHDSKAFGDLAEGLNLTTSELKDFVENAKLMEQFADVAGMTADAFIEKWGTDAVGALNDFVSGLANTEASGKSAVEILNDMEITEVRMSDAVLRLANSDGVLVEAQQMANKAWEENIALNKEAEARFSTTDSKVQLLSNSFETLKILIGDKLKPAFDTVVEGLTNILNSLNSAIKASSDWKDEFITSANEIEAAAETEIQNARDIGIEFEATKGKIEEHRGEVETLISKIEELGGKDKLTAADEDALRKALEELNKIMPTTAQYYMDLASGSKDAASAVRELLKAEIEYAKYKNNLDAYEQGRESQKQIYDELKEAEHKYYELKYERERLQEELDTWDPQDLIRGNYSHGYLETAQRIKEISDEMSGLAATIQKTKVAQQALSVTQGQLLADISQYEEAAANAEIASGKISTATEEIKNDVFEMTDAWVNSQTEGQKAIVETTKETLQEIATAQATTASASAKAAKDAEAEAEAKAKAKQKALEERYRMTDDTVNAEGKKNREKQQKELEAQLKAEEKAVKEYENALHKYAQSKGSYFPSDLAKSISKNSSQVTNAVTKMVSDAGTAAEKTASKVGEKIAEAITVSMQDALKLGNALSDAIAQGGLTVNGKKVGSASSYNLADLGLNFSKEKYDDWLNAMYAKGFDSSLSGAEIAKILNTGVGVTTALSGSGSAIYDAMGRYDWDDEVDGIVGEMAGKLSAAMEEEYGLAASLALTPRQISYYSSLDRDRLNRERGYYTIGDQAYDYYSGQPIQIVNNFNVEVESPATAAKKIQEAVEVALYTA